MGPNILLVIEFPLGTLRWVGVQALRSGGPFLADGAEERSPCVGGKSESMDAVSSWLPSRRWCDVDASRSLVDRLGGWICWLPLRYWSMRRASASLFSS